MSTVIIDTNGNAIKAQTDSTASILEAIKAIARTAPAPIVIPAPIVNFTPTIEAAPAPVNNITVQPAAPAVNNVTVKPADVVIPAPAKEATITTDRNGKKTLEVVE